MPEGIVGMEGIPETVRADSSDCAACMHDSFSVCPDFDPAP